MSLKQLSKGLTFSIAIDTEISGFSDITINNSGEFRLMGGISTDKIHWRVDLTNTGFRPYETQDTTGDKRPESVVFAVGNGRVKVRNNNSNSAPAYVVKKS